MWKQWGCEAGRAIDRHLRKTGSARNLRLINYHWAKRNCLSLRSTLFTLFLTRDLRLFANTILSEILARILMIFENFSLLFFYFFFFLQSPDNRTTCLQVDVRFDSVYECEVRERENLVRPIRCVWFRNHSDIFVWFSLSYFFSSVLTDCKTNGEWKSWLKFE